MAETRAVWRELKPYCAPESLAQLDGPLRGDVVLRRSAYWAPGDPRISIDSAEGLLLAYRVVLTEGAAEDQVQVLNPALLLVAWPYLTLPDRVRDLWEGRFPELREQDAA